ncbi:unnamed protein product [Ectocarpus sp. 12 AP-2014]
MFLRVVCCLKRRKVDGDGTASSVLCDGAPQPTEEPRKSYNPIARLTLHSCVRSEPRYIASKPVSCGGGGGGRHFQEDTHYTAVHVLYGSKRSGARREGRKPHAETLGAVVRLAPTISHLTQSSLLSYEYIILLTFSLHEYVHGANLPNSSEQTKTGLRGFSQLEPRKIVPKKGVGSNSRSSERRWHRPPAGRQVTVSNARERVPFCFFDARPQDDRLGRSRRDFLSIGRRRQNTP